MRREHETDDRPVGARVEPSEGVLMQHEQSPDFGYDLAHEEVAAPTALESGIHPEQASTPRVGGKADLDEDFGYDEAHDL
jgi:hypothetical protein